MNQKLAIIIFAFAFMVAIVAGFYSPERENPAPGAAMREKWQESLKKNDGKNPVKVPAPQSQPSPRAERSPKTNRQIAAEKKLSDGLDSDQFTRKYGDRLAFTRDGNRVVRMSGLAIRNDELDSSQKKSGFRSASEAELVARGKEIFTDARALLGIPASTQFADPVATPGESSGQLFFQQTEDGVPIYPGGTVSVLVGADGELRTVDSSVYPATEVENSPTLPAPADSREVLFVIQAAPVAILRHAYETQVRGVLSVIDASTGAVLLERSRRVQ